MKEKCICTTFKLSVAALAGVALAGVAVAEGQKTRPTGNPLNSKSPALEQRAKVQRDKAAPRAAFNQKKAAMLEARRNYKPSKGDFGGIAGAHPQCPNPAHDCCSTGTVGCSDEVCCNTVCDIDPFCCNTAWDAFCVGPNLSVPGGSAIEACGIDCTAGVCPNPEHDCCTSGTPGCSDAVCCSAVCAVDSFCCVQAWDNGCKAEAESLCGLDCPSACPNPKHDCCTTGGPGCSDEACCSLICSFDTFCCNFSWDIFCVIEANANCVGGCNPCPNPDHDCSSTGTPGCSDTACCEDVCCLDSFCCLVAWDGFCVSEAATICGGTGCEVICPDGAIIEPEACGDDTNGGCNSPSACEGASGNCCFPSFGIGCEDPVCTNAICSFDPFCCSGGWDSICAAEACSDPNCQCDSTSDPYTHIACGDSVCGTMWADGNFRDTDWYKFCVYYCGTDVTWTVTSEIVPSVAFILNDNCGAITLLGQGVGQCPVVASASLLPGTFVAFAAAGAFNCFPCGGEANDYTATLTCAAPRIDALCPGDIAGGGGPPDFNTPNGVVDTDDLLKVINGWGPCDPPPPCG